MNTDKTEVKVKLLKFFEMNHQRPDEVVSLTMPNYGLWQTAAVRNPDDDSKRAYDLVCVMPYHKHRKAGDKITVYQWVIDECMHEIIFKRAASTPQPTAEGQRLSAEEILKDELQKGNPLNYELTRRQTLNHFWDKIIAAMYRFTAQHHNKGDEAWQIRDTLERVLYAERDGYITIKTDSALYLKMKRLVGNAAIINNKEPQGECEKVSRGWEPPRANPTERQDGWFFEYDFLLTVVEVCKMIHGEDVSMEQVDAVLAAIYPISDTARTPSPITKEQIVKVLREVRNKELDAAIYSKIEEAQATAIFNLIQQGGERVDEYEQQEDECQKKRPAPVEDRVKFKQQAIGEKQPDTTLTEANEMLKNPATVEQAKEQVERFKKQVKICPHCGSSNVIMFDSDNDLCNDCHIDFPGT